MTTFSVPDGHVSLISQSLALDKCMCSAALLDRSFVSCVQHFYGFLFDFSLLSRMTLPGMYVTQ